MKSYGNDKNDVILAALSSTFRWSIMLYEHKESQNYV